LSGDDKIADDHVRLSLSNQLQEPPGNLRLAELGDGVWQWRSQVSSIAEGLSKGSAGGNRQGHEHDSIEFMFQSAVKVILGRGVEREQRNAVSPRKRL
jgi:hypothetical protein